MYKDFRFRVNVSLIRCIIYIVGTGNKVFLTKLDFILLFSILL